MRQRALDAEMARRMPGMHIEPRANAACRCGHGHISVFLGIPGLYAPGGIRGIACHSAHRPLSLRSFGLRNIKPNHRPPPKNVYQAYLCILLYTFVYLCIPRLAFRHRAIKGITHSLKIHHLKFSLTSLEIVSDDMVDSFPIPVARRRQDPQFPRRPGSSKVEPIRPFLYGRIIAHEA